MTRQPATGWASPTRWSSSTLAHPYVVEEFTPVEAARLEPHVSNLGRPVFALTNLPEVVKGAVFARYSRSPKSLRRLLLDEFLDDVAAPAVDLRAGADEAATRAGGLYQRVFADYGDDSVAQLGGAHVAVEQASNLLTKVLEWGRLGAYLEQSTRYIPYDDRPGGRWRYYRDPDVMASPHAGAYIRHLDASFAAYAEALAVLGPWARERWPQGAGTSDAVYRQTMKAKVCDLLRGMLPAATVSNVGIFASGQAYEALLLRLAEHDLAESRDVGRALLGELRTVIPSFLTRVDRPERGGAWAHYLASTRDATRAAARELLGDVAAEPAPEVALVAWDPPDAEVDLVTGMLYPHTDLPELQLRDRVEALTPGERLRAVRAYAGERGNRRHKPGRALERITYRFDVLSDYGAFRDLQRHRMMTIEWQALSPRHGYQVPPEVDDGGAGDCYRDALERQADLWDLLHPTLPVQAQYAVGLGYRVRYSIHCNARAAMQMIELRTTSQGHPTYRRICQQMHTLIAEVHPAVAALMTFADHRATDLERLDAERAAEARRLARESA